MYLTPRVTAPIYCPFIMPSETFTLMLYCSPHCAVNCTAVSHYIQWCNPAIIVKTHCLLLGLHDTQPPSFPQSTPHGSLPWCILHHLPAFLCALFVFWPFPAWCMLSINLCQVFSSLCSQEKYQPKRRKKISTKKKKGGRNSVESELWLRIMSFEIESSLSCVIFGDLACVFSSLPNPDV